MIPDAPALPVNFCESVLHSASKPWEGTGLLQILEGACSSVAQQILFPLVPNLRPRA